MILVIRSEKGTKYTNGIFRNKLANFSCKFRHSGLKSRMYKAIDVVFKRSVLRANLGVHSLRSAEQTFIFYFDAKELFVFFLLLQFYKFYDNSRLVYLF